MEIENARFCPGCGAEQKSVVTATSIPVSEVPSVPAAPEPESPEVAPMPAASVPVSAAPEVPSVPAAPEAVSSTPAAPASVPVSEAVSSNPAAPESIPAAPVAPPQSVVPNGGISTTVFPMGVSNSPTVVVTDESKLKTPERRYTGGHIALCLITAAIMAGIAGLFAGLYFSLLWTIR